MSAGARIISAADPEALEAATEFIEQGKPIVIPTETLFGLTGDATNKESLVTVFGVKDRDVLQPTAVYLADTADIFRYAEVESELAADMISDYLPGPLTVVLRSKHDSWYGVVSAEGKIGIRVSSEPFVTDLVRQVGKPLIATSANIAGETDCLSLRDVKLKFSSRVPLIVYRREEVGPTASTVIDLTGSRPRIIRQGTIDLNERLAAILRENS